MTNQLMFHNTTVQSVNHNNQIWITSTELSKLLQYADSKSVTKIYSRNADEFTDKMTMVVKMTTIGINNSLREKSVRIFSLRGAHLVAMFANTEVAKEVRKWLLDLADKEISINETISHEQQQIKCGLSDEDLYILARLVFIANHMREKIKLIEPALRIIDSSYSASFHSMSFDFCRDIEQARLIINRETAHIKTNHLTANWNVVLPVIRITK